jgi:hypothetical protein
MGAERELIMNAARIDRCGAAIDPGMPFLPEALDPAAAGERLTHRLAHLTGGKGRIRVLAARLVRHKKGRRCLIEYDLGVQRPDSSSESLTLLGKVRAKGTDRESVLLLQEFRRSGFREDAEDGISVPEAVGVVPEFRMWLQRKAPGVPATTLLAERGGVRLAGRIAEAIHKIHGAGIAPRRRHSMQDELRILRERIETITRANPRWSERLDRILAACARLAAAVNDPVPCGIHRDFYPDQVLVDGDCLSIVDFDLYCEGDPALDAGNFAGHLTEQALRTLGSADALAHREQALEERFLQLEGERHRAGVRAYAVLTLARHIWISTQIPDRNACTEALLELVEHRLGAAGRSFRKTAPDRRSTDKATTKIEPGKSIRHQRSTLVRSRPARRGIFPE